MASTHIWKSEIFSLPKIGRVNLLLTVVYFFFLNFSYTLRVLKTAFSKFFLEIYPKVGFIKSHNFLDFFFLTERANEEIF